MVRSGSRRRQRVAPRSRLRCQSSRGRADQPAALGPNGAPTNHVARQHGLEACCRDDAPDAVGAPTVARLVAEPTILGVIEEVLGPWCVNLQLNLTQGIQIDPGARVQVPHRDQDMWGGPKGAMEYMVNVMWALEDFTATNGATRVWPGSNKGDQDEMLPEGEAVSAVMPRGSALLYLGSTLHSAGANLSARRRRGLIVSYCLGWLKPWENQWLAYPPEVARLFEPEIAALVGYRQHLPSLGNYEGQCPSLLLGERSSPDHLPFTDALRDDQNALIEQYYESLGSPPRIVLADGP